MGSWAIPLSAALSVFRVDMSSSVGPGISAAAFLRQVCCFRRLEEILKEAERMLVEERIASDYRWRRPGLVEDSIDSDRRSGVVRSDVGLSILSSPPSMAPELLNVPWAPGGAMDDGC